MLSYIKKFNEIGIQDISSVGGKNASLGEMFCNLKSKNINIPDGFAITAAAFHFFIDSNQLKEKLHSVLETLDRKEFSNLGSVGEKCRALLSSASFPVAIAQQAEAAYKALCGNDTCAVAVRSSATAEDLPNLSFAGQHESFLNIQGPIKLIEAIHKCYVSLYTNRAIKYREDNGYKHEQVALSVGIQKMVRADTGCSGIGFTLDPESGFKNVIHISGVWGLGENIVQGTVTPDEFYVFKPSLREGKSAIIQHRIGAKELTMRYAINDVSMPTINIETPEIKRSQFVLSDTEVTTLAKWFLVIEDHYKKPMDIEWAKDGFTGELYILQARPETVHSQVKDLKIKEYRIDKKGNCLISGSAIGNSLVTGIARLLRSPRESGTLKPGEIVVTNVTSPDWDPVLKKCAAIITDKGGRTSHAAIVARELGIPAIVGSNNATSVIKDGEAITVSCCEGKTGYVYQGLASFSERLIDYTDLKPTIVKPMLITGDPDQVFNLSFYPVAGVGLLRMEFIITHYIKAHPLALSRFHELSDEKERKEIENLTAGYPNKMAFFIDKLSEGIATIAAAFYPREVIVRMSDFKTNEYANLIGGKQFEPREENPMLGFRGASRYYNNAYKDGFRMECDAVRKVRNEMGLTNVKIMVPFCRTIEEGKKVVELMELNGLDRHSDPTLEIYLMAEIPVNILLAEEFAKTFDGFSIGSNDLTQLILGVDRDSEIINNLFSEKNPAVLEMIASVISKAKKSGRKIGLCGQAASDFPEVTQFLVEQGIDSISFTPDALFTGIENIRLAEKKKNKALAGTALEISSH